MMCELSDDYMEKYFYSTFKKQIDTVKDKSIVPIIGDYVKNIHPTNSYSIRANDEFAMTIFSTYGVNGDKKDGDPICDKAGVLRYSNAFITCVADGCGWGDKSVKAASEAVTGCLNYLSMNIKTIKTTKGLAKLLVQSFIAAQNNIIKDKLPSIHIGITTLLTTCTFFVVDPRKGIIPYTLLISVGDCRAFHVKTNPQQIISLCGYNRTCFKEIQNCGGMLGAANDYMPELKGSVLSLIKNEIEDKIIVVTDGFYDNIHEMNETTLPLLMSSATLADFMENFSTLLIRTTDPLREQLKTKRRLTNHKGKLDHATAVIYDVLNEFSLNVVNTICPAIFDEITPNKKRSSSFPRKIESSQLTLSIGSVSLIQKRVSEDERRKYRGSLSPIIAQSSNSTSASPLPSPRPFYVVKHKSLTPLLTHPQETNEHSPSPLLSLHSSIRRSAALQTTTIQTRRIITLDTSPLRCSTPSSLKTTPRSFVRFFLEEKKD